MKTATSSKSKTYAIALANILVPIMQEFEKANHHTTKLTKHEEKLKMYLTEFLDVSIEHNHLVFASSDNGDYEEQWNGFRVLSNNFLKGKPILPNDLLIEISMLEDNKLEVFKLDNEKEDHIGEVYFDDFGTIEQTNYINQNTFEAEPMKASEFTQNLLSYLLIGEMENDHGMVM